MFKRCPKCRDIVELPKVSEKHLEIHTDDALSITFKCSDCNTYLTAHISYKVLEVVEN